MSSNLKHYLLRNGAAVSVLINTATGGSSNQSFSARNWQWKREQRWNIVWFIDWLCKSIEEDHCMNRWVYWMKMDTHVGEYSHFKMGIYNELRFRPGDPD